MKNIASKCQMTDVTLVAQSKNAFKFLIKNHKNLIEKRKEV